MQLDLETENHIFAPEKMNGIWLIHRETSDLYILGKDDAPTFDTIGPDDDLIDDLHAEIKSRNLTDTDLEEESTAESLGFDLCLDWQRRFSAEDGYYYA